MHNSGQIFCCTKEAQVKSAKAIGIIGTGATTHPALLKTHRGAGQVVRELYIWHGTISGGPVQTWTAVSMLQRAEQLDGTRQTVSLVAVHGRDWYRSSVGHTVPMG